MSNNYNLLIIGNPYDAHLVRFVKYFKQELPQVGIDLFGFKQKARRVSPVYAESVNNLFLVSCDSRWSKIIGIRTLARVYRIRHYFHKVVAKNHYDIVNIHYPMFYYSFILREIRETADKLVLTPWGSDVYRVSRLERRIVKKLYDAADIVTGNGLRFTDDFMQKYKVPMRKFRQLSLFGDQFDYYLEHENAVSVEDAKKHFGIQDYYAITCGYNANPEQRHLVIIEAINNARSSLPENVALVFPFTYGGDFAYKAIVKERVDELGYKAVFCEQYLSLGELLQLRKATDMFIHIQTTDANNASLKEYLWFGKNVINGGWLKYDGIETSDYKPYHISPSVEALDKTIIKAYHDGPVPVRRFIIEKLEHSGYRYQVPKWNEMFESLVERS